MRFLVAFPLLTLPLAAAAAPPNGTTHSRLALQSGTCSKAASHYAIDPAKPLKPRKLTELPSGNMYVAVYRRDANGCEAPIVVKYDVGRR
jgi:hypothetical protein